MEAGQAEAGKIGTSGAPWVLVVEDDAELRDAILIPGLCEHGFNAVGVGSAVEMYRRMLTWEFACVVIDVGLPDEDGYTAVKHLRQLTSAGLVLLTGRGSAADRVRGLDAGADAYLAKPADATVLAATLRSVIRRLASRPPQRDRGGVAAAAVGDWTIDLRGWRLLAPDGTAVKLSASERTLLSVLLETPGEPVARASIISRLADDVDGFDPQRVEMLVFRLRRKTAAAAPGHELPIRAVRGVGYTLAI